MKQYSQQLSNLFSFLVKRILKGDVRYGLYGHLTMKEKPSVENDIKSESGSIKSESEQEQGLDNQLTSNRSVELADNQQSRPVSLNEESGTTEVPGFQFNVEKTEGQGEDADPIFVRQFNQSHLAVFDGMGGAGSTKYNFQGNVRTGAWIGSRTVRDALLGFITSRLLPDSDDESVQRYVSELQHKIVSQLKNIQGALGNEKSKLKSTLIRELPTTLSMLGIQKDDSSLRVHSLWAGDSRNYILTHALGLQQLSSDDLKGNTDPFENLTEDAPLSNLISAEGKFELNYLHFEIKGPCILFSATDGCFGYYNSPMKFEYELIKYLLESSSWQDWGDRLKNNLVSISGDDFSMSLLGFDYSSFEHAKELFQERKSAIAAYGTNSEEDQEKVRRLEDEKRQIENQIRLLKTGLKDRLSNSWETYKSDYLGLIEKEQ